jgi:hypothetical protein
MPAMLALAPMSAGGMVVFFLAALICFLLAAFAVAAGKINLVALGLGFVTFVWLWNAAAAT